jgi:hypothetical protein
VHGDVRRGSADAVADTRAAAENRLLRSGWVNGKDTTEQSIVLSGIGFDRKQPGPRQYDNDGEIPTGRMGSNHPFSTGWVTFQTTRTVFAALSLLP